MRIVHVMSSLGTSARDLAACEMLASLCEKYEFELIAPRNNVLFDNLRATRVKLTPMDISSDKSFSLRDIYKILGYFKRGAPFAVCTHTSFSARVAAMLSGVRRTVSCTPEAGVGKIRGLSLALYNAATLLNLSPTPTVSERLLLSGIPKERIVELPIGVNRIFRQDGSGNFLIVYIADGASMDFLLPSLLGLWGVSRLPITVLAPDVLVRSAHLSVASIGFTDKASVLPHSALGGALSRSADLFVYLSSREDVHPFPLLSAMSSGTPIIAPRSSPSRDFIDEGKNGLLFSPRDQYSLVRCAARVLGEAGLSERLSRAAEASYLGGFSTECMVRAYDKFYRALLGSV